MIQYRHYGPNNLTTTKHYGISLSIHNKRKTLDLYMGKHVFVWFWSKH